MKSKKPSMSRWTALVIESGLEVRLLKPEVYRTRPSAREIFAVNHVAALKAEWEGGVPIAYLFLKEGSKVGKGIPLGLVHRGGMKYLEHLAAKKP